MGIKSIVAAALFALTFGSAASADDQFDVDRLPLDKQRIHQALQQSTIREQRIGLNLRYIVDVYAQAPSLVLFTREDNLENGPVPYGGPTHKDMLEQMTPKEYRAPFADFSALLRWLAEQANKK